MTVFDRIYETNEWGGEESPSGPGAGTIARKHIAPAVDGLVTMLGATSVLDIGCGDGFWMPDLPGYIGVDVSLEALRRHRERHPDRDLRIDDGGAYPECELVIVRCVIQHLSYADAAELLARVRMSGAKRLLATSHRTGVNKDIETGQAYWVNMEKPPFSLGTPLFTIKDGHSDLQDWHAILGLWRL